MNNQQCKCGCRLFHRKHNNPTRATNNGLNWSARIFVPRQKFPFGAANQYEHVGWLIILIVDGTYGWIHYWSIVLNTSQSSNHVDTSRERKQIKMLIHITNFLYWRRSKIQMEMLIWFNEWWQWWMIALLLFSWKATFVGLSVNCQGYKILIGTCQKMKLSNVLDHSIDSMQAKQATRKRK